MNGLPIVVMYDGLAVLMGYGLTVWTGYRLKVWIGYGLTHFPTEISQFKCLIMRGLTFLNYLKCNKHYYEIICQVLIHS